MLKGLDWIIIASYIVFIVFIGLLFRKQAGKSLNDFFLGGRKLPWWLAGLSMVATTFAADTPLVVTELVGKSGISGNWLWWNFLIGGMLTTFFFARLWRRANVLTELEFISIRYSGKEAVALRGIRAAYMALIMNTLIIAWVNLALMTIIEVFFGISGGALLWIMFGAMFLAALYSTTSGLIGVAVTDAVQFFIALSGAIILAVFVISSEKIGGISGLKEQVPVQAFNFFPKIGGQSTAGVLSISIGAFLAYGLVQWWASWYPGAEPGGGGSILRLGARLDAARLDPAGGRLVHRRQERHAAAQVGAGERFGQGGLRGGRPEGLRGADPARWPRGAAPPTGGLQGGLRRDPSDAARG